MRQGRVKDDQLTRQEGHANTRVGHDKFNVGHRQRQIPKQAARPMARHVVVKARAPGAEKVDARGHGTAIGVQLGAEHASGLQRLCNEQRQIRRQLVQRDLGVVDVAKRRQRHALLAQRRKRAQRGRVKRQATQVMHAGTGGARHVAVPGLFAAHRQSGKG